MLSLSVPTDEKAVDARLKALQLEEKRLCALLSNEEATPHVSVPIP